MEELGWRISERKRGGAIHLTRPDLFEGEGKQGTSMTVGEIGGAPGVAYCWTSSVPGFTNEHPYDAAEVLSMARYGGNLAACDRDLVDGGWGWRSHWDDPDREVERYAAHAQVAVSFSTHDEHDPWADVDIERALTEPPVMPALYERTDGTPLLYPASVHWITAEPESGKTWMLLHATAQVLSTGGHVTLLDYENGLPLLERLLLLGVPREKLIRQLHLKSMPPSWVDAQPRLLSEIQSTGSRLVGIDSCQSCMASANLDPIDNYDVLRFYDFARRLTIGGAAVTLLDHLPKSSTASERYPLGAGQKLAQATVAIGVQKRSQFAPGRTGVAALYLHKDRHGSLRKAAEDVSDYQMIGSFELISDPLTGQCDASLRPYAETTRYVESAPMTALPYQVMQRVTDLLIDEGTLTQAYLEQRIDATNTEVKLATYELERRGFITKHSSSPTTWRIVRNGYRANQDRTSPYYTGDEDDE